MRNWRAALYHLDRLIEANSEDEQLLARRASGDSNLDQSETAVSEKSVAQVTAPQTLESHQKLQSRGRQYLVAGEWDEARSEFMKVFNLAPDDLETTFEYAGVLLLAGDLEDYKQLCARLLNRGNKLKCFSYPERRSNLVARICLLATDPGADTAQLSTLAERAVKAESNRPWNLHSLGLAHYRAGQYGEAIKRLRESMESGPNWPAQPVNWLVLAMAHYQLGNTAEAQQWFDKSVQSVESDRQQNPHAVRPLRMHEHDWITWLVLRREAESLMSPNRNGQ
jgi:tetratricopeptide (TPR) repeat protein